MNIILQLCGLSNNYFYKSCKDRSCKTNLKKLLILVILLFTSTGRFVDREYKDINKGMEEQGKPSNEVDREDWFKTKEDMEKKATKTYNVAWTNWFEKEILLSGRQNWMETKPASASKLENYRGKETDAKIEIFEHGHWSKLEIQWKDDEEMETEKWSKMRKEILTISTNKKEIKRNISEVYYVWKKLKKEINLSVHMVNGNRKSSLNILHWNLGNKHWVRKTEAIQCLLDEEKKQTYFSYQKQTYSQKMRIILQ